MVFNSDRQRRGFFASKGNVKSNVNPDILKLKDLTGRKLKVRIQKQNNRFFVKDSQGRTIATGITKPMAIRRAQIILRG